MGIYWSGYIMDAKVLLVDDDKYCLDSLSAALRLNGIAAVGFDSPIAAANAYDPDSIDVVIIDYHLPDIKGTQFIEQIRAKQKDVTIIVITGDKDKAIRNKALTAGANAFFTKPLDIQKLINQIQEL